MLTTGDEDCGRLSCIPCDSSCLPVSEITSDEIPNIFHISSVRIHTKYPSAKNVFATSTDTLTELYVLQEKNKKKPKHSWSNFCKAVSWVSSTLPPGSASDDSDRNALMRAALLSVIIPAPFPIHQYSDRRVSSASGRSSTSRQSFSHTLPAVAPASRVI